MTFLPLLLAAGLTGPAHAGDDGIGIRLKVNTDLFQVQSGTPVVNDEAQDDQNTKITTVGLMQSRPRFEVTYGVIPNLEVGAIVGYSTQKTTTGNEVSDPNTDTRLGLTAAYNVNISDGMRFYAQPMFIHEKLVNAKGSDGESSTKLNVYGANLGLRIRLVKGATFDPSFEYLMGSAKAYDKDGELVSEDVSMKVSSYGLKAGISVRF